MTPTEQLLTFVTVLGTLWLWYQNIQDNRRKRHEVDRSDLQLDYERKRSECAELKAENEKLKLENEAKHIESVQLAAQNAVLKQENDYFAGLVNQWDKENNAPTIRPQTTE